VTWIKATNGVVIDIPETLVDYLVSQGHEAFESEDEARGKRKRPALSKSEQSE
jgi:hypothetical protein